MSIVRRVGVGKRSARIEPVPVATPALPKADAQSLREISRRHGIDSVRVFGSAARGEAGPQSDLDLLVTLGPGRGFRDLMDFCEEVETALGRRVDVVVEDGLSPFIKERVPKEAVAL
jgi:predicted nucleotidyltransferase